MGIYGALSAAVSGLRAQSFALENISGNIANSQTIGYKRLDTGFFDLIPDSPLATQVAGTVAAYSVATNTVQGDIQAASLGTNMAVNGEGFFMVSQSVGYSDGRPQFASAPLYTRRGDFQLNRDGYLVNGAGYFLNALGVDPKTGNVTGSAPGPVQFSTDFLEAKASTSIDYRANLPKFPLTNNADPDDPGSELLDPADFDTNPLTGAGVTADDADTFLDNSIAGQAITAYNADGSPVKVQFRWAKIESSEGGGEDKWALFYQSDSNASGTDVEWTRVDEEFAFSASGKLTSPGNGKTSIDGLEVDGVTLGDIDMNFGSDGLTQYADSNGTVKVNSLTQDGYGAGELIGIAVADNGRVVASYSNGQTTQFAQIPLATFNAANMLQRMDGGAFAVTSESGPATIGATGQIVGGALEASNTDIADEFTKLIVTQQAYSANTRIISTSSEMLTEAVNMVR
jgi:flagellar hook protein FlgE